MEVDISIGHNNYRLTGTLTFNDLGAGVSRLRVYDDPKPTTPGAAITTQILLAEIPLNKPSGTLNTTTSVLTLSSSATPLASNSGAATWARQVNGNGDWSADYDVTNEAGDGAVKLEDTDILAGAVVALIEATLR